MNLKIVNIKKFILSVLFVLLIIIVSSLFISKVSFSYGEPSYKKVSIIYGDTLWSISKIEKQYNEYYANKDIRYIVEDIKKINNMTNSNIYEGQEILIPIL